MKKLNYLMLLLGMMGFVLFFQSCKKEEANPCENIVCENGGTCVDGSCECPPGTSGVNCETVNLCFGVDCQNGGTCIDGNCDCPDGFTGEFCQTAITIQQILDGGKTPLEIYESDNTLLDSLFGKTYAGGLIFYFNISDGSGMVAASSDLSSYGWGCYGTDITNVPNVSSIPPSGSGAEIGDGITNSLAIVASFCSNNSAAEACTNYEDGINNDWFLPSINELYLMWVKLADSDGNGINTGTMDPGNIGGFVPAGFYWSSSENSNTIALSQEFGGGILNFDLKSKNYRVRAIRKF